MVSIVAGNNRSEIDARSDDLWLPHQAARQGDVETLILCAASERNSAGRTSIDRDVATLAIECYLVGREVCGREAAGNMGREVRETRHGWKTGPFCKGRESRPTECFRRYPESRKPGFC